MIYAGIDYSMSSPSICVWDSSKPLNFMNCKVYNFANWSYSKNLQGSHNNISIIKQPSFDCNEERFLNIGNWAKAVLLQEKVEKVSLEGYSYGSKGNTFEIGENTGVLKQQLFFLKIPFIVLAPTDIKKKATGNGSAGKSLMYESFLNEEGIFVEDIIPYDKFGDSKMLVKKKETPWELKPVDDIIDSYFIMRSHPDIVNL